MPDAFIFSKANNATTLAPTVMSSPQLENQETTRVVTDSPLGNATVLQSNETFPLTNGSSSVPDEKIAESANATTSGPATTSGSTTSGPTMSTTITSGNGSVIVEIQRYEEDANNGLHVIYPAVAMNPGTYSLEIDYETLLDGKAIYSASFNQSGDGK